MKRPSYFISARSASADLLASELVLAITDMFPKVEGFGILGEWSQRTKAGKLAKLTDVADLHDAKVIPPSALLDSIKKGILENTPQVALLAGYSTLHHDLAAFCKQHGIPVVLYEVTPARAIENINVAEVSERLTIALSIQSQGSGFLRSAKVPYIYIGTPHKDKVDRVMVQPQSFNLQAGKPVISFFPGGRAESFDQNLALHEGLARSILKDSDWQVVISIPDTLSGDDSARQRLAEFEKSVAALPDAKTRCLILQGMHLELLALSSVAITGCGAITVECGLLQTPFIPIYKQGEKADGAYSLLNQSLGKVLVKEYPMNRTLKEFLKVIRGLAVDGPERSKALEILRGVKDSFTGFAAENAADYIGREVAKWKQVKRSKGSKTA